ncbi:MAG: NADP-dependent malic enzyme [Pseudomonadales bacterium]|nr:NADP-dependent malic enzyme [Candidatus Woesebacteria bacterium]MCB9800659.1 NADP-dependent malic enzyme [Pseudomonadales bacterium]
MISLSEETIELHKKHGGKLGVTAKVSLSNSHDLSLAYTPGVSAVSKAIAQDKSLARKLTINGHTVAIISDGSAVLGLGNIGPEAALPVMEGKALLIKEFAGLDAFPLVINTQKPEEIIQFVRQVAPSFSAVNLEDIGAPNCFLIEEALQDLGIPVFHDDQHGTAVAVTAALTNATKVIEKPYEQLRVGIVGAGAAGLAVSKMLLAADCKDEHCNIIKGLPHVADVIVFDSSGALYAGRDGMNVYKQAIAGISNHERRSGKPEEALKDFDVVIGLSGPGTITAEAIGVMADRPVVFAMANPDPEIMPDDALAAGAYVVATGRSDFPNQINNILAFPAVFKIAHEFGLKTITTEVKIALVRALASLLPNPTREEIVVSPFYPNLVETLVEKVGKELGLK